MSSRHFTKDEFADLHAGFAERQRLRQKIRDDLKLLTIFRNEQRQKRSLNQLSINLGKSVARAAPPAALCKTTVD